MMEKASSARQGVVRLPPGFRFHPTDEELVMQYLLRKVFSCPLPAAIIPEIHLAKHDPWDLPGGCEEERYFFNHPEAKYLTGNRSNRGTKSGYWKATGKDKQIVASRSNQVIGMKKVLVFYQGKAPSGSRTDYIMHEYRLTGYENRANVFLQRKNTIHSLIVPGGDWVLCRIFKKKRVTRMDADVEQLKEVRNRDIIHGNGFIDMIRPQDSHQDLNLLISPESSCVTSEVSDESKIEEISSVNMSSTP